MRGSRTSTLACLCSAVLIVCGGLGPQVRSACGGIDDMDLLFNKDNTSFLNSGAPEKHEWLYQPSSQENTKQWVYGMLLRAHDNSQYWPPSVPERNWYTVIGGKVEAEWGSLRTREASRDSAFFGLVGASGPDLIPTPAVDPFSGKQVQSYQAFTDLNGIQAGVGANEFMGGDTFLPMPLGGEKDAYGNVTISGNGLRLCGANLGVALDIARRGPSPTGGDTAFYGKVQYATGCSASLGAWIEDSYVDTNFADAYHANLVLNVRRGVGDGAWPRYDATTPWSWDQGSRYSSPGIGTFRGLCVEPVLADYKPAGGGNPAQDGWVPVRRAVGVQVGYCAGGNLGTLPPEGTYGIYIGQFDPKRPDGAQLTNGVNYGIYGEMPTIDDSSDYLPTGSRDTYAAYWRCIGSYGSSLYHGGMTSMTLSPGVASSVAYGSEVFINSKVPSSEHLLDAYGYSAHVSGPVRRACAVFANIKTDCTWGNAQKDIVAVYGTVKGSFDVPQDYEGIKWAGYFDGPVRVTEGLAIQCLSQDPTPPGGAKDGQMYFNTAYHKINVFWQGNWYPQ